MVNVTNTNWLKSHGFEKNEGSKNTYHLGIGTKCDIMISGDIGDCFGTYPVHVTIASDKGLVELAKPHLDDEGRENNVSFDEFLKMLDMVGLGNVADEFKDSMVPITEEFLLENGFKENTIFFDKYKKHMKYFENPGLNMELMNLDGQWCFGKIVTYVDFPDHFDVVFKVDSVYQFQQVLSLAGL